MPGSDDPPPTLPVPVEPLPPLVPVEPVREEEPETPVEPLSEPAPSELRVLPVEEVLPPLES